MRLSNSGWIVVTVATLAVGDLAPDVPAIVETASGDDFAEALTAGASLALLGVSLWVLLLVVLGVVRGLPGRSWCGSDLVRRAVFVSAAAPLTWSAAHADVPSEPPPVHALAGLRMPDRPAFAPAHTAATTTVTVRPGDTLWDLAAHHLQGRGRLDAVARATDRWYATNRRVIGPDPDLLLPGQRLVVPSEDRS